MGKIEKLYGVVGEKKGVRKAYVAHPRPRGGGNKAAKAQAAQAKKDAAAKAKADKQVSDAQLKSYKQRIAARTKASKAQKADEAKQVKQAAAQQKKAASNAARIAKQGTAAQKKAAAEQEKTAAKAQEAQTKAADAAAKAQAKQTADAAKAQAKASAIAVKQAASIQKAALALAAKSSNADVKAQAKAMAQKAKETMAAHSQLIKEPKGKHSAVTSGHKLADITDRWDMAGPYKFVIWRELSLQEKRVDWIALNETYDQRQSQLKTALTVAIGAMIAAGLISMRNRLKAGDVAGIGNLTIISPNKLNAVINPHIKSAYEIGKVTAAKEMKVPKPVTPTKKTQLMNLDSSMISEQMATNIDLAAKQKARDGFAKGVAETAIVAAAAAAAYTAAGRMISHAVGNIDGENINKGRSLVFDTNIDQIQGFLRSEILDDRTCNFCEELDQQTVTADDPMADLDAVHDNCVHPDTVILAPGASGITRLWYKGSMVRLSFGNNDSIAVTPNHVLLTDRGFLAAKFITKGDKIISTNGLQGKPDSIDPNIQHRPPSISEIFITLVEDGSVPARKMPIAPENFHGDGIGGQGEIDIISTNGLLLDSFKSSTFKHIQEIFLDRADSSFEFLKGSGSFTNFLLILAAAFGGNMSSSGISSILSCSSSLHHEAIRRSVTSDYNTRIQQATTDNVACDPQIIRNLMERFPGQITLNDITNIELIEHNGFVYDLTTTSTLYLANSIISSNCRGTWVPILLGEDFNAADAGLPATLENSFDTIGGSPTVNSFTQLSKPLDESGQATADEVANDLGDSGDE